MFCSLLDRIIAGSWMLLVSMAVAVMLLHKQQLLAIRQSEKISSLWEQVCIADVTMHSLLWTFKE